MKPYYLFILFLVFAGCSPKYNPENIQFGDFVKVKTGFYKDCVGQVIEEMIGISACKHIFIVTHLQCKAGSKFVKHISVCNLEKIIKEKE